MKNRNRFAVGAEVRVKNPGINGTVLELDGELTMLGEYWHTIKTKYGERREPGCNLELIPKPQTNVATTMPIGSQTSREFLLNDIKEILATMPPRETIHHDTRENQAWFGRVSAAIEKWNPMNAVVVRENLDLFFSNRHARERSQGLNKLVVLLEQAEADLRLETAKTQQTIPTENGGSYHFHPEIERVSGQLYRNGHYREAALNAFIHVIDMVKTITGLSLDGDKLMNRAFGCDNQKPVIQFNSLSSEAEIDEQRGFITFSRVWWDSET